MTYLLALTLVAGIGGVAALLLLLRNLSKPSGAVPPALLAGQYSPDRYSPLSCLLDASEYEFLKTQPGFTQAVGRHFRSERRAICRQYLKLLRADFAAIYHEASALLLYSRQDRSDLAQALFQERMRFAAGLVVVEFYLGLHAFGLEHVQVDHLVAPVSELQRQFESAILAGTAA